MKKIKYLVASYLVMVLGIGLMALPGTLAYNPDVTICHATGSSSNPFVTIHTDSNSINGHFDNSGTPNSGHEDDLLFEGNVDCPTGTGGGGGGGECITPTGITALAVDTQILNDGRLLVSWSGGSGAESIEIKYGFEENDLNQTSTSTNDGSEEISGLTNGVHYWFTVQAIKVGCNGPVSDKIDPLP